MSRRASSNRGRRMRGGTGAELAAAVKKRRGDGTNFARVGVDPTGQSKPPPLPDKLRQPSSKVLPVRAKRAVTESIASAKQLKADNPTIVTIFIFICSIVVALSIPGMYFWKPEWYFVVPVALVICILAGWVYYGKKEVGASKKISKFLGGSLGIGLVIFLLLRLSSSIGIGDGTFKKGWFDNNYCDEIKEEDT